jgi:hypothetical protein
MSKHTKGPWNWTSELDERGKLTGKQIIYDNNDKLGYRYRDIAHLPICKNSKEVRANARLIAAAPDLLDAAKAVMFARLPSLNFDLDGHPDMLALEAAIKKAEGRD